MSLFLVVSASVLTLVSVRYAEGMKRVSLFVISMACLALSIYVGRMIWGFWPGLFTLFTGYMLVSSILPWMDLARRRYVG
ncbi:MAG: hypothetical protein JJ957_12250 [Pseudomonadales bacterium]|nr:hypothetical protein [Pseudomonadales bacterium]MBO6823093.1 hypothetical protein [Pseudomonadales bacterium]